MLGLERLKFLKIAYQFDRSKLPIFSGIEKVNCFFDKHCSIIDNSSELPLFCFKKTDESISAITFSCDDIATLIKNLDPNKDHGHDMINIRILKLCGKSISKLLDWIFQSCMKLGKFPTDWKKVNVVPVR